MRSSEKDVHGVTTAQAHRDQRVRGRRLGLHATLVFCLAAFLGSDPLTTAEREFRSWIGSYSAVPSARIALAEQAADSTWTELKAWPDGEA
ncbi:hypothetical protein [Streptomyces sp. NBC_00147]|uniref:hypothetical protein n=1 Tax=Streptomyces sp. NBC_00147 TaxID=2975667 RepID=UPI002F914DB4